MSRQFYPVAECLWWVSEEVRVGCRETFIELLPLADRLHFHQTFIERRCSSLSSQNQHHHKITILLASQDALEVMPVSESVTPVFVTLLL